MANEDAGRGAWNPYAAPKSSAGSPAKGADGSRAKRPGGRAYSVECPCGRSIGVDATQAGMSARCECGAEVPVPSLGRLRENVGQSRYESSASDTIRRMIHDGELPGTAPCAVSGRPTDDMIGIEFVMPRVFKSTEDNDRAVYLFGGIFALFLYSLVSGSKFHEEDADRLRVPLRVASRYHNKVRRMGQSRLRRLVSSVPAYAELLEENVATRIDVLA